jgi:hypothetical protein
MHARPGLSAVLDRLSREQLPALVRGDCGYGNEPFIGELEDRSQTYLFKLRQTKGVQRLLARQFAREEWRVRPALAIRVGVRWRTPCGWPAGISDAG